MDRLESQLANLGNTILNFLEDKYALQPGEIFQNIPPLQIIFKKGESWKYVCETELFIFTYVGNTHLL